MQPPKAVYTADDLYHYSLPMFAKLEKDMPGMKLRLMGLRCTHLVSMKKGDVDFFGRARQSSTTSRPQSPNGPAFRSHVDADGWQIWPDEEFEDAARQERIDEAAEIEQLSQEVDEQKQDATPGYHPDGATSDYRRYGNGFAWRSVLEEERAKAEEAAERHREPVEQWLCPICSIPQPTDERAFNEHIDGCLSRQTIKEMVQRHDDADGDVPKTVLTQMPANTAKRKRGRPSEGKDDGGRSDTNEKRPKRAFFV